LSQQPNKPTDKGLDQPDEARLENLIKPLLEKIISRDDFINGLKNILNEQSCRTEDNSGIIEAQPTLADALKGIVQQLAPLQELAPRRTQMKDGEILRLKQLRDSLLRPEWSGAGKLSSVQEEKNVAFIGEVASGA